MSGVGSWFVLKDRRGLGGVEACDRCGARARVWVVLVSGRELFLCRHHAHAHEHALKRLRSRMHVLPT